MKIIQILTSLRNGGTQKMVINLCNELSRDHEVILFSFRKQSDDSFVARQLQPEVRLIQFDKKKGFDIRLIFRLFSLLKNERPHLVHTHLRAMVYCFLPCFVYRKSIRFFHTIHSLPSKEQKPGMIRRIKKLFFRMGFTKAIVLSGSAFSDFVTTYNSKAFAIIPNGISPPLPGPDYEKTNEFFGSLRSSGMKKILVYAGRLMPIKNLHKLILAHNALLSDGFKLALVILGNDGTEKKDYLPYLAGMKTDSVFLLGEQANPEDYIINSDACCLFSDFEGCPIFILEAFALKKVVLASNVPGINDIVEPGENGLLSKGAEVEDIYQCLRQFLNTDDKCLTKMQDNNYKKFMNQFHYKVMTDNYVGIFEA